MIFTAKKGRRCINCDTLMIFSCAENRRATLGPLSQQGGVCLASVVTMFREILLFIDVYRDKVFRNERSSDRKRSSRFGTSETMKEIRPHATNSTHMLSFEEANALLLEFGSPLYVYDSGLLEHQLEALRGLFDGVAKIFFASFCNSNPALLERMRLAGVGCLASSETEVAIARWAGFTPEEMVVTGAAFAEAEMRNLVEAGLKINLDSFGQLAQFAKLAQHRVAGIRVSVESGLVQNALPLNSCIGTSSRVGILECELDDFFARAQGLSVVIDSLHVYTGTNQLELDLLLAVTDRLLDIAGRHPTVVEINLGGGFGLPYSNDGVREFPWREFIAALKQRRLNFERSFGRTIEFAVEPGRSLIGPTGFLLASITDVKQRADGAVFVGTDTSLSNFPRPYIYGAKGQHPISLVSANQCGEPTQVTVCGNALASGDRIAEGVSLLGTPVIGDIVVVHDAGAYGYSMSSQFSGRLRPAEVLYSAHRGAELIRRRETCSDLFSMCQKRDLSQGHLKLAS